ncbi:MAG: hypothetical protein WCA27_22180 [Candidatus Sulfotelmatobacter sp.]|jgi:hypothetical protein
MDDSALLYVLTRLDIDGKGNVTSRNLGVTFSLFEAEEYRNKSYENDFETHRVNADWRDDAETTAAVSAMREFRLMVEEMQMNALL